MTLLYTPPDKNKKYAGYKFIQPNNFFSQIRANCLFLIEGGISGQSDKNKKYAGYKFKCAHAACFSQKEAFLGSDVIPTMLYYAI